MAGASPQLDTLPTGQGQCLDYSSKANLNVKVLDFVKSGGPECTVDRTVFEMWLGPAEALDLSIMP